MNTKPSAVLARDPGAAMTLAQGEILAPVALAVANLLVAGIDRIARLLRAASRG